jgi:IS605 OrfB family transposase
MTQRDVMLALVRKATAEKTTVHTRLRVGEGTGELLGYYADRFGRDLRRLYVLLSKGVPLLKAKRQFIQEGLTARQFNSIAAVLRGRIASRKRSFEREIRTKTRRLRAIQKRLRRAPSRGGYGPRVAHEKRRVMARLLEWIKRSRNRTPSLTFGGRKLWNAQHALQLNGYASHEQWKKAWREGRSGEFFLIGSKDESFGNQSCHWDPQAHTLTVRLPDELGGHRTIPNVSFPYPEGHLEWAVTHRIAVSYRFVRKPKGWYVYATTQAVKGDLCTTRARGVLGVDLGPDRVAVVETDRAGNPVDRKTYRLPLYRKRAAQARARIEATVSKIGGWAVRTGKPVAMEELDFEEKKAALRERGKDYARMLSSFRYGALRDAIRSRCRKMGVEVLTVDPAHSSTMGVIKYAAMYGLSGDEAAALVLGRRAMNLEESLPARTALGRPEDRPRHVWEDWQRLGEALRSTGRHAFTAAKRGSGGGRGYPVLPARASPG